MAGSPTNGGFFQGISQAVSDLKTASGQFAVSEQGGQALISAVQTLHGKVVQHLQNAHYLGKEPPLGTTPAAGVYKPFLATVATDPVHGAVPVLTQLKKDLEDAEDVIRKSMANYQQTDQGAARGVSSSGSGLSA